MANSIERLKAKADIVTPVDNNHGGVGVTLETLYKSLTKRKKKINDIENLDEMEK